MFDPLKRKTKIVVYSTVAFLMGIGLASGMGWTDQGWAALSLSQGPEIDMRVVQPALEVSDAFVEVSRAVTPAVVRIVVRRRAAAPQMQMIPWLDPRMPDGIDPRAPEQEQPRSELRESGGSGFIVSEDGYILTNDHVVNGAEEITVYLQDGRAVDAELVGTDPFTDVATIRIEADDLVALQLGSAEDVRVGEWVLAIGNPGFGSGTNLDYSVTQGIVSAKGRPLNIISNELAGQQNPNAQWAIEDFIQTDAVVNPGNSGGPLVSLSGRVVGINSAIASTNGYFQGYSFAIPIDLAKRVMDDLVAYGQVRRPRLGVSIVPVDALAAEGMGLPRVAGVFIQFVDSAGPALGILEDEDVIVAVDGKEISRTGQLQAEIAKRRPGDEVTLTVYRDGDRRDVTVELDEAPLNPAATPPTTEVVSAEPESRLGLRVAPLTDDLATQYGLQGAAGSLVITDVRVDGPAYRAGLRPGDRLVTLDGVEVEAPEDVGRILEGVEDGEVIPVRIIDRAGSPRTLFARLRN